MQVPVKEVGLQPENAVRGQDAGQTIDKPSQEEKPSLRYVIQNRVVKMIRIDENGKDLYLEGKLQTTSYIYSTITYPKDFSEAFKNGDKASYEKAKQLDGLTIAALTNSFYKAK